MNKYFFPLFFILFFGLPSRLWAGACCGGGSGGGGEGGASVSPMLENERGQVSLAQAYSRWVMDAGESPGDTYFRDNKLQENKFTTTLQGQYALSEHWQVGGNVPVITRENILPHHKSSGLGDISLGAAYEFMPLYFYHPWRPQGFFTMALTLPTAPSFLTSKRRDHLDVRGSGHKQLSSSLLFFRKWGRWQGQLGSRLLVRWEESFTDPYFPRLHYHTRTQWGAGVSAGASYKMTPQWQLGILISPHWNSPLRFRPASPAPLQQQQQWTCTTTITLQHPWSTTLSTTLSYFDQTLLGPAQNAPLWRGVALSLVQLWPR